MKRKRQAAKPPPGAYCIPFGEEQREALHILMQGFFADVFINVAKEGYREHGRGLIVWLSTTGLVGDLQPPIYLSLEEWQRNPLLVNTPHDDLIAAMQHYDPRTSHIVLAAGPSETDVKVVRYTWWKITRSTAVLN